MIFAVDYSREEMIKYIAEKEAKEVKVQKDNISHDPQTVLDRIKFNGLNDVAKAANGDYSFTPIKYVDNNFINEYIRTMYYKCIPQRGLRKPEDRETMMYTHRNTFKGVYIIPKIFLKYIPMIDCDDIKLLDEIQNELKELKVGFKIYNSSHENHFWIFCDKQLTLEENVKFLYMIPGDHRYPHIANIRKEFVIRALPKKMFIPKFVKASNVDAEFSNEFNFWIKEFEKYWDSDIMHWYLTKQLGLHL